MVVRHEFHQAWKTQQSTGPNGFLRPEEKSLLDYHVHVSKTKTTVDIFINQYVIDILYHKENDVSCVTVNKFFTYLYVCVLGHFVMSQCAKIFEFKLIIWFV